MFYQELISVKYVNKSFTSSSPSTITWLLRNLFSH